MFSLQIGVIICNTGQLLLEEERLSLKVESIRPLSYHEHCAQHLQLKQDHQQVFAQLVKVTATKSARKYIQILEDVH